MISLYIVADRAIFESDEAYFSALRHLAPIVGENPGVVLQVRAKEIDPSLRFSFVGRVSEALGGEVAGAFLNAATGDALRCGFGGVHWPEAEIPVEPYKGLPAGASVHSLNALRQAEAAGASFAVFGPVFNAGSKPVEGIGIPALGALASAAAIPLLAIGGVTPERVRECLLAGAVGVAAVTGILRARDPAAAIARYLTALHETQRLVAARSALSTPSHST